MYFPLRPVAFVLASTDHDSMIVNRNDQCVSHGGGIGVGNSLEIERLDFFKLDVEGMEMGVLSGAKKTLAKHKPTLYIETLKSGEAAINALLRRLGCEKAYSVNNNLLASHESDPLIGHTVERDSIVCIG